MAVVKLAGFTGEQPRITPRLLPPAAARTAIDARLDDGSLRPYNKPLDVQALEGEPCDTIFRFASDWLAFPGLVHFARGPVATDRLYYTGDGAPKIKVGASVYGLAVPRPTATPTATLGGSGSGDIQTRAYVYTFVTAYGEESEPSPATADVDWQPGKTVTISAIEDAPADPLRNITKQRFYRTQTGSVGTDFYFIAERDVSGSDFLDDLAADAFAEPLPSRHYNAPPDTLSGLIPLPNGMMAAFSGKRLYFSEPYQPHAWPERYVLSTDIPIVALAATGTTIWVLTEGTPYRVTGSAPDAMVMDKIEAILPCRSPYGVVDLGHAVAWPSADGLAAARLDGGIGLVTGKLFAPDAWRRLNPGTMRAGQIAGRWIGSYAGTNEAGVPIAGSLIVDLSGDAFLVRTAVQGRGWFHDAQVGASYYLEQSGLQIKEFAPDAGDPAQLYWRSKQFVLPRPDVFGAILIETGPGISQDQVGARQEQIDAIKAANALLIAAGSVGGELAGETVGAVTVGGDLLTPVPNSLGRGATVGIYADEKLVWSVGTLDRVARLPSGFKARIWEIDVFCDIPIDQITLARTTDELKTAGGGP